MRVRLLPWRPRMHKAPWNGWDMASEIPSSGFDDLDWVLLGLVAVLLLPIVLVFLLFSAELALVLLLLPFFLAGQLLALLPWQLALRSVEDTKHYVSVTGTRKMLEARRYYRSLRIS